jgi:hypothetical protein
VKIVKKGIAIGGVADERKKIGTQKSAPTSADLPASTEII